MNSAAIDIKDMLDSTSSGAGIGVFGTTLFVSREPTTPDFCMTIYDTGGEAPEEDKTLEFENPSIMIRVRGSRGGYVAAMSKAFEIQTELHGKTNSSWNGTRYIWIFAKQSPYLIEYDDNDRPIIVQNYRIARTPT